MRVAGGTVQGASDMPGRGGRLEALLAVASVLVIVALMALMVWGGPFGAGVAEIANPGAGVAGSAIVHDDPGNVHRTLMPQGAR